MNLIDFIGPSYNLKNVSVDCQRAINIYPDQSETGNSKSNFFMVGTPGLEKYIEVNNVLPNVPARALYVDSKDNFCGVFGQDVVYFYYDEVDEVVVQRVIGTLSTTTGPVSIADNGFQVCFVDGPNLYIYIYADDTFNQYNPEGWLGSNTVSYFSTYFVFIERDTQKFYISASYDGRNISPLDFASKEGSPDHLVTSLKMQEHIWLFGKKSIEIHANTGDPLFPIKVLNGGYIEIGCVAPFSAVVANNMAIWLGRDQNGAGTIYAAQGAQPQRISNNAIEQFIQGLSDYTDAVAYSYQQEGHYFYVINFPTGKTTLCYDLTTGMWHERQYFNTNTAQPERHRGQYHVFWRNKHLVSDYAKNFIYEMKMDFYTDNGNPIQRIKRSPHLQGPGLENVFFKQFELSMDVGTPYTMAYAQRPKISLRTSDDMGKTWSDYNDIELGNPGEYLSRARWFRLGRAKDRVWEVSCSDPIKIIWLNAFVEVQVGRA